MTCMCCEGSGWRERKVPHPYIPGHRVTVTRLCVFCGGKGTVQEYRLTGKDRAAGEREEK